MEKKEKKRCSRCHCLVLALRKLELFCCILFLRNFISFILLAFFLLLLVDVVVATFCCLRYQNKTTINDNTLTAYTSNNYTFHAKMGRRDAYKSVRRAHDYIRITAKVSVCVIITSRHSQPHDVHIRLCECVPLGLRQTIKQKT